MRSEVLCSVALIMRGIEIFCRRHTKSRVRPIKSTDRVMGEHLIEKHDHQGVHNRGFDEYRTLTMSESCHASRALRE